ncbi:hypothetical protein [Rubrivirga sp.]|uniref:hypothetical protein n=1 Tax=Rubrivirga sp. TaxID=1885344 RepID=UPI003C76A1F4
MRYPFAALLCALLIPASLAQTADEVVITADVERFWQAFDAVSAAPDSVAQYRLLDELFVAPGTPGLHALMERRGYTAEEYVTTILGAPRFWASVRENTLRAGDYAEEIGQVVERLRALYPALRPAQIFFTVGALRTGGTTLGDRVLIGSEIAMADSAAVTDELPDWLRDNLRRHFDSNPIEDVVLLNAHEYVHTQQGEFGADLLSVALQEGVAEYVSVLAAEQPSAAPSVAFGQSNEPRVRDRFATEMFSGRWNDWLYNNTENTFGVRDLGYYVGYAIAEQYVERSADRTRAIARLIELDYQDPLAVETVVEASRYFDRPLDDLRADYERERPTVVRIAEFENGTHDLDPAIQRVNVTFSAPMNPRFRGFDYGPLGEDHVLRVTQFVGLSDDRRTIAVDVALRPGSRHQLTLSDQFRDDAGRSLVPYTIDVTTGSSPGR